MKMDFGQHLEAYRMKLWERHKILGELKESHFFYFMDYMFDMTTSVITFGLKILIVYFVATSIFRASFELIMQYFTLIPK